MALFVHYSYFHFGVLSSIILKEFVSQWSFIMENKKNNRKLSLELFLYFFKIGWYTFGGGWSIIAQIQRDYVDKSITLQREGRSIYRPLQSVS